MADQERIDFVNMVQSTDRLVSNITDSYTLAEFATIGTTISIISGGIARGDRTIVGTGVDVDSEGTYHYSSFEAFLDYNFGDVDFSGSAYGDDGYGVGKDGYDKPVVIDLDGDGAIDVKGRTLSEVVFDWDNDGYAERTSWVAPNDAFLVIDLNSDTDGAGADGVIDHAHEIAFGDWTATEDDTDLQALRTLFDYNNDGAFTEQDFKDAGGAIRVSREVTTINPDTDVETTETVTGDYKWTDFRLWQDLDQDGEVDLANGELRTLDGNAILDEDEDGDGERDIAVDRKVGVRTITSLGLAHLHENGNEVAFDDESDDVTIAGNTLHGAARYDYLGTEYRSDRRWPQATCVDR